MGEEREIIADCLAGRAGAFDRLHGLCAGPVQAYFLRSGFSPADADDLGQEVFLRVYKSLSTFDERRGTLRAWLGAIARNVARRRWAGGNAPEAFDPDLAEEVFAAPDNPGDTPEAREEVAAVGDCVDKLPAELARLVRLRYVDARTTRGVAATAGLPEATVRLRLKEAADLLAKCLKAKGIVE